MRIAQISDTHISLDFPDRLADLERCVSQLNALDPLPDAVVHSGDISHDGTREQYAVAAQALDRLKVPWFVMAGNKDNREALRDAFSDEHLPCATRPFVQYAVDRFPVRIVCVDTVCETSNKGELCQKRLDNLDRLLSQAPEKPAAVFMHHPPFDVPVAPEPFQFLDPDNAADCLNILKRHQSVRGLYCGHMHRPYESRINNSPAVVMTAVALGVRFGETGPVAPTTPLFLLHEFAPDAADGKLQTVR